MPISRPLSFFLAFNTSFIFLIEQLHDCQTVFLLLLFKGNLNFSLHCQRIILLNIGYLVDSFFSFSISIMSSHIFWPPKFLMIGQLLRMPFTCWAFFLKLTFTSSKNIPGFSKFCTISEKCLDCSSLLMSFFSSFTFGGFI